MVGLNRDERRLLEEALDEGRLTNILMTDGQRLEDGFARERMCQLLADRGWLRFMGWIGAPQRAASWSSVWVITDAARRALALGAGGDEAPDWVRTLRDSAQEGD